MFSLVNIDVILVPEISDSGRNSISILRKRNNKFLGNIWVLAIRIIFHQDSQQFHNIDSIVVLASIDAVVRVDLICQLIHFDIPSIGYQAHIVVVWQVCHHCWQLLSHSCQFLLINIYINHKKIARSVVLSLVSSPKLYCGILLHKFIRQFVWIYMLSIVCWKTRCCTTNAAFYCLLVVVYRAVVIEDGLALTCHGNIL